MFPRLLAALVTAFVLAVLSACGGGDDDSSSSASTTTPAPVTDNPTTGGENLAAADARAALQELLDALRDKDAGTACGLLTDEAANAVLLVAQAGTDAGDCEAALGAAFDQASSPILSALAQAEIGEVIVDGDNATASVTLLGRSAVVPLVQVDGEWKVAGLPGG